MTAYCAMVDKPKYWLTSVSRRGFRRLPDDNVECGEKARWIPANTDNT